jgi:hypothetical protein
MVELILRLPSLSVLDKLLPLLQQLKIPYQTRNIEPIKADLSKKEAIIAKIKRGEMNITNFETVMADFEESRQDVPLYGRD